MGKFSDLAKQGIRYQNLDEEATPENQPQQEEQGNFSRGFNKAMLQVPQTLGGAAALVGDLTGAEGLKEYGLGVYEKNSAKIDAISKDSDSLSNVIEGDASGGDWLAHGVGYVGGQALQAIATGGVGGFIGSQLAKRGIREVVARGAQSAAAKQVAGKVASRGAAIGAGTALFGSNLTQEAGSIYPEALDVAAEEGRELTGQDKARVVGSALAAAGVDTAMDALMIGRVLKGARKPGEGMLRAGAREVPGAMGREAITEGAQTGIERFGAGKELGTADAIREYVDATGLGALGGGMGGAASVIRANNTVPESGPFTRAANVATEQQALQLEYDPQPLIGFPDGTVGTKAEAEMWLLQFPEAEREGKRRELMGRDPETGKRVKPEAAPEPTHAQTPEEEASFMAEWAAQADPVDLDQAHAILNTPGAKGKGLMVAPHPDGGFTLVESNKLTIDTQARIANLQKPVKSEAAGDAPPAPVTEAPQASEPEWKTNPYTAYKFADAERAATFMANKGADPALFEVRAIDGDKFAIKRRTTPITPAAEGASNADDAVLSQASEPVGRGGIRPAAADGSGESGGTGAAAPQPGAGAAADAEAGGTVQPADVRSAAGADTDSALTQEPVEIDAFHGTGAVFEEFSDAGLGSHFTTDPKVASDFAGSFKEGGNVRKVKLKIRNPLRAKDHGGSHTDAHSVALSLAEEGHLPADYVNEEFFARLVNGPNGEHLTGKAYTDANLRELERIKAILQAKGYDSIVYENTVEGGGDTYIAFDKQQAKPASAKPAKEPTADVPERPQVPEEAPPATGEEGARQADAEPAKPTALAAAREKHKRQDDAVAKAAANIAARKAAKEQAAPADPERDDGADIPLAFYKKVKVPTDVLNEETGATEKVDVPADVALKSVREDIANLRALLKCMKG